MTFDDKIPEGAYGIWCIPLLNVKLPVYFKPDQAHLQAVIDKEHSALIDNWGKAYRIVDHFGSDSMDGKGNWNIQKVIAGTVAYMIKPDGVYKYECYLTGIAKVYPYMIEGRLLTPVSSLDILNACCVGVDSTHNYVAVFKFVRKIK